MTIILITSCGSRKSARARPTPTTQARFLKTGSIGDVSREWLKRVRATDHHIPIDHLYSGRGFKEARTAATEHQAALFVVSAGLGLRAASDNACSYSLTVTSRDVDSIGQKISPRTAIISQDWWRHLTEKANPVSSLISRRRKALFVLALPKPYLEMIAEDLNHLTATARRRVRIVGPRETCVGLGQEWVDHLMPYDERLERLASATFPIRGTRSDFPQRAARHFLGLLDAQADPGTAHEHHVLVAKALSGVRPPRRITRPRLSDDAMKVEIGNLLEQSSGRVGKALRILRDHKKISCEQGRFKRLFWEVSATRSGNHG